MQSVSSRIWTRAAVSISYDDNHYTTGTSYANIVILANKISFLKKILYGTWQYIQCTQPLKNDEVPFSRQ